MSRRPTLTVLIPNFNHARYLPHCLDAIAAQSWIPDEIVVVDDCSTDNSMEILAAYQQRLANLRVIRNESNLGAWLNCEKIFALPTTEYMVTIAADDFMLPGYLEKSMNLLWQNPQAALCFSYPAHLDEKSGKVSPNPLPISSTPCYLSPDRLAETLNGHYIPGHTSVMKTAAFRLSGGLIEGNRWHSDWFFLLVMAFRGGACFVPEALSVVRPAATTYSSSGRSNFQEQKKVIGHIISLLSSPLYSDVYPYFVRSRAFKHFGDEAVRTVFETPELQTGASMLLIQQNLWEWSRAGAPTPNIEPQPMRSSIIILANCLTHARRLRQQGKHADAAKYLSELASHFPSSHEVFIELSTLFQEVGDLHAAKQAIEAALNEQPDNIELLTERGCIDVTLRNFGEAKQTLVRVTQELPFYAKAANGLARVYEHDGDDLLAFIWRLNACIGTPCGFESFVVAAEYAERLGLHAEASLLQDELKCFASRSPLDRRGRIMATVDALLQKGQHELPQ